MLRASEEKPVTGIRAICGYIGIVCMLIGLLALVPLLSLLRYAWESVFAPAFIFPGIACMIVGYTLYFVTIRGCGNVELRRRDGAAVVFGTWVCAIIVYALPFVLGKQLTVSQAVFEATSGLTTTGLSIVDVTSCPNIYLVHRTLMHYFGGIGLLLVLTCIVNDTQGLSIYHAEGHTDRLLPSSLKTARAVLVIYTAAILGGIVAYRACGMPLFDAFATSVSAVSTGGFVVDADSIGGYHSAAIEIVSIVLMLVGATNFLQNFLIVHGRFSEALHHEESRAWYLTIVAVSLIGSFVLVAAGSASSWGDALRTSLFQTVSIITTTGFQTIPSFAALPSTLVFLFVLLMLVGSEAGSTAGGMKMYRVLVMAKSLVWMMKSEFGHRHGVRTCKIVRFGKKLECSREERRDDAVFCGLYASAFIVGSFIFTLSGCSFGDAVFEFASCLGNVGVSIGVITPDSPDFVLWTGIAGMFLGRLEIVPVFMGAKRLLDATREWRNLER
jgi:trk system potassium uptake protein TrkH